LISDIASFEPGPSPDIDVPWEPGSVWATYPYQLHAACSIGWTPIDFKQDSNTIAVQVDSCTGESECKDWPCLRCEGLQHTPNFRAFIQRATDASEFTNREYLSLHRFQSLLTKLLNKCRELHTQARILCSDSDSFSDFHISYQTLGSVSPH
jgi:hypothetical protein